MSAIEYEFSIGQSRRIEQSTTVFKEATTAFPGVTSVIGGPVIGGFINDGFLQDYGGWTMEVDEDTAIHTKLALVSGFDPRKSPTSTFSSTSTAIADFTNWWARPFFEPSSTWAASGIQGYFPQLRARLLITGGTDPDDVITLIPLARPATTGGSWWNPTTEADRLTGFGTSQLYLPKEDIDGNPFDPAISTEYQVWVYGVAISKDNPLHIYEHPVDLWEKLRIQAGIPYDATVLPSLKSLLGDSLRLALRIKDSSKLSDFDQKVIYGPFRLSTRIENGERVLFSTDVSNNAAPTETITLSSLRTKDFPVFDLDESTVITSVTVKTQSIIKWTTEESDQPEVDSLISRDAYPQSIENSADDIPAGTEREVVLGDIPGMIWIEGTGPFPLEPFLTNLGSELFDRFGRGGIVCEPECLPSITAKLGEEVLLDLPHLPGTDIAETPISQRADGRGGAHPFAPQPFQIIARTELPEGPKLKLINSLSTEIAGDDIELIPEFTLDYLLDDYGNVSVTNSDDLAAAMFNCRCDYATGLTEPTSGTLFTTVPWESLATSTPFEFAVGPVEAGATLWVRLRCESPGFRPGPWTSWQSVELVP